LPRGSTGISGSLLSPAHALLPSGEVAQPEVPAWRVVASAAAHRSPTLGACRLQPPQQGRARIKPFSVLHSQPPYKSMPKGGELVILASQSVTEEENYDD